METIEKPWSCDTFVAFPPATANGNVIFGKNSDRPDCEPQEIVYRPSKENCAGEKLQCTYIEIEEAPSTYAVILSKPAWMWGAEMGANEKGVCIGNEAVWTKLNGLDDLTEKLLGMDLVRLGLERGGNAKESLDVITSLLSLHGQGGTCIEGKSWAYHNSFLIVDSTEGWVLETAGPYWVAQRITEGVRNISNQLTITTEFDLSSPNLIEMAQKEEFYSPSDGPFNFAKVFQTDYRDPVLEEGGRFVNGRKLLKDLSKTGQFGVRDMMSILRDEESGINLGDGTCGSMVSMLAPPTTASPCCHWLTGTPCPALSLFKPFIFGPDPCIGKLATSPDYGDKDPRIVIPRFQKQVDRCHELCMGQKKLLAYIGKDDPKGAMIVQNIKELETNCIDDVEEILKNYEESSFNKVKQLFEHMCSIELNFYK